MSNPIQKFLVGQRVFWRVPSVHASEWKSVTRAEHLRKVNLFARASIVGCRCRFPGTPLAEITYQIKTEGEVWSETEWGARDEDLFLAMPASGKIWNRTRALRKPSKKKKKKK